jgi:hypothetical protein
MKTMKKLLLGLTLGLTLVSCSTDEPIRNNTNIDTTPVDEPTTTKIYYNLQWESNCNVRRLLIVNGYTHTLNLGFGNDTMTDIGFNQGDVIQLQILMNGACNSNNWSNTVRIWKWNNPQKNGQHIVMSKGCSNCGGVLSEPFIVE